MIDLDHFFFLKKISVMSDMTNFRIMPCSDSFFSVTDFSQSVFCFVVFFPPLINVVRLHELLHL